MQFYYDCMSEIYSETLKHRLPDVEVHDFLMCFFRARKPKNL